jgi:hypothetical protein
MADAHQSCPHCRSGETVRTAVSATRTFHFCLACARAFEAKVIVSHQPPSSEPRGSSS